MGGIGTVLEIVLLALLALTLLHAVRLQRALGHLRQDRASLADAVTGLDTGTRHAESGIARLHQATDQLGGRLGQAAALRDDLAYLAERGEVLADRLETLVRTARTLELEPPTPMPPTPMPPTPRPPTPRLTPATLPIAAPAPAAPPRSQAERNLLAVLQGRR